MADAAGPRWALLPQAGDCPGPRSSHAMAAVGDRLFLLGGELQPRVPLPADLHCYDLRSGVWQRLRAGGACPGPRVAAGLAAVGDKLYLYGGRTGVDMGEGALSDMWVLDTASLEWGPAGGAGAGTAAPDDDGEAAATAAAPLPPPPRSYHAMASVGADVYVFGGCGAAGRLNDLWRFDTATSSWEQLPSSGAVAPRGGSTLVADPAGGGTLYVLGGFNGAELADCHAFDLATRTWACPGCCGGSDEPAAAAPAGEGGGGAAAPAASAAAAAPGARAGRLEMPVGRSVFGAALHSGCGLGGEGCCGHAGHIVAFGGEVAPSDKGHAGAGNFTDALFCMAPCSRARAAAAGAQAAAGAGDADATAGGCCKRSACGWHPLQCSGGGGGAHDCQGPSPGAGGPGGPEGGSQPEECHGPGPRGWFAATAVRGGALLVHGGLDADNERRGEMFMLQLHPDPDRDRA